MAWLEFTKRVLMLNSDAPFLLNSNIHFSALASFYGWALAWETNLRNNGGRCSNLTLITQEIFDMFNINGGMQ